MECSYHAITSFSFDQDTGKPKGVEFLETFKNPKLLENNPNNSRNNTKSQIKTKRIEK